MWSGLYSTWLKYDNRMHVTAGHKCTSHGPYC